MDLEFSANWLCLCGDTSHRHHTLWLMQAINAMLSFS